MNYNQSYVTNVINQLVLIKGDLTEGVLNCFLEDHSKVVLRDLVQHYVAVLVEVKVGESDVITGNSVHVLVVVPLVFDRVDRADRVQDGAVTRSVVSLAEEKS